MKGPLLRRLVIPLCLAACPAALPARAADPRPSWECLPEDTVVMVRLPRPAGFLETLRTRTKFGAVVLGPDRMRKALDLAVEAVGESLEQLEERFARFGLGRKDLEAAFAGDMGLGVVMRARGDDLPPLFMALAWMEPGQESAERMVAAFHRGLEEAEGEAAPQRVDLEMAGHPVTWAAIPILRAHLGDLEVGEEGLGPEKLAELAERARQAPKTVVGKEHVFLARVGGRLVAGRTMPPPPRVRGPVKVGLKQDGGSVEARADEDGDGDEDPDRLGGADEARGIFERFLASHGDGGDSPLADVLRAPGVRAALPTGEPLVEMVLDPRPLLKAAIGDDAEKARRLSVLGLDGLGPVAMRQGFEAGRMRLGILATLPAPRAGLLRILEQEPAAAEVPSFVTSEVMDFTQISLDLAQAYRTLKEFAVAEGGDQAANMFMTAEVQAQGWLGLDLEKMLANIGSRHWILTYPSQVAAAIQEARRNRDGEGGAAAAGANRVAFVWKLVDDAPVIALLPKIAPLAQVQVVEEQGFQGIRLPAGVSVFAGQEHLVVAMGDDTLEKTLAGIRNPPAGAASLRESDVPRKGADLVGLGPCRMFSVGDAGRTGGTLGELREFMTAMAPDDVEDRYRDILGKAQALVPSAEEMEGMFGVGASITEVNDAGIAIRSAWEMPAP